MDAKSRVNIRVRIYESKGLGMQSIWACSNFKTSFVPRPDAYKHGEGLVKFVQKHLEFPRASICELWERI